MAEKRRRRVQASHERVRKRNSMLFRLVQPVVDVSLLLSRWRPRAHLPSLFLCCCLRSFGVAIRYISPCPDQTSSSGAPCFQVGASWMASQYDLSEWCASCHWAPSPIQYLVLAYAEQAKASGAGGSLGGFRDAVLGVRVFGFGIRSSVPDDAEGAEVFSSSGSGGCICWCSSGVVAGWMFVAVCVVTTHTLSFSGTRI